MIDQDRYQLAATTLLGRRTACTQSPRLETDLRPKSIEDALVIQEQMISLSKIPVIGWKCCLPPADDEIVAAPIFVNGRQANDTCRLMPDRGLARVEPEIAFVLGRDLPAQQADFTEDQINDAVASTHLALELMQDRWQDGAEISPNEKLADCLLNQGVFVGPEIDKQKAILANEITIQITQDGETQQFDGKHPNACAGKPVRWLINYMSKRGIDFKAGQAIITGSFCGIVELKFDQPTSIEYSDLGEMQVEFQIQ